VSTVPVDAINAERLERWRKRLSDSHATALITIGIGHDHNLGALVLCAPEETQGHPSNAELAAMLRWAADELVGR
jgi:hypothetical protein